MKPSQTRLSETSLQRSKDAAALEKHIAELFRRMPRLAGFSIRHDLELEDVSFHAWPGTAGDQFYQDLLDALADLADELPGVVMLMRGRTFARTIH
jgi:hypothetical protein